MDSSKVIAIMTAILEWSRSFTPTQQGVRCVSSLGAVQECGDASSLRLSWRFPPQASSFLCHFDLSRSGIHLAAEVTEFFVQELKEFHHQGIPNTQLGRSFDPYLAADGLRKFAREAADAGP
jgi:hypothetical protein